IGNGDRTASFNFSLQHSVSEADVFGWWVAAPNRATDTPFVIQHAAGVDTVYQDQTINNGQWNLLGTYAFDADTPYSLIVSNAAHTGSYVVADAVRITSETSLETVSVNKETFAPDGVSRIQSLHAYPNPFNPQLIIRYNLGESSTVKMKIFNVRGHVIRELDFAEHQDVGYHELVWDGRDARDQVAPTGVYFARLEAGSESQTIKLIALK
ncbi:MAG: T9SS type A sorting domain-containing protein, partial [Candidatus Marinimicrobia bacterium]|nr:T9SS type A sorting domain-containing protein [Candidatus Neomarinimicrobiota bacterium]